MLRRLTADDPETRSADIVAQNVEWFRALFPDAFRDGKVDCGVLTQLLGGTAEDGDEKYGLTWHGKRHARRLALTPSAGTLLPCPEESVDWDTTQNLVIEGDNLEVLKLLQRSYAGRVKLIYIDPPYNTGKDFVYKDDYRDNLRNYLEVTGQVGRGGRKVSSNTETSGRFHTDWLNMMYPRLKLARNLLREDGIIISSIDDNEEAELRLVMDDIYGEHNRLGTLVWHLGVGPTAGHFLRSHESMLCYARDKSRVPNFVWRGGGDVTASALKRISAANPASDIRFPAGVEIEGGGDRDFPPELGGAVTQTVVDGQLKFRGGKLASSVTVRAGWAMRTQIESWLRGEETYDTQGQRVLRIFFSRTGLLMYQKERTVLRPRTVLQDVGTTADGSDDIERCGLPRRLFDFPKPVSLIRTLVGWITEPGARDIVLDFFAGAATTGHAVLEQNAADGGNRRYVCVQLPEPLPSPAILDNGERLATVADIAKARLRGAADRVRAAASSALSDVGNRVFKLAPSNIRPWEPRAEQLPQELLDFADPITPGRTELDVLYELLLKLGLDLAVPIEEREVTGKRVYAVGGGVLLVCLTGTVTRESAERLAVGIASWHKELAPAGDAQVVVRDAAFTDDVTKTNFIAILRQRGLQNVRSF